MTILGNKNWLIKLTHWEYWPMWVFYFPVWLQHFWLSIKLRNLYFFLATNPAIDGFILSDSKFKTLQLVPQDHRPKMIYIPVGTQPDCVLNEIQLKGMGFPVMIKPDIGFRGLRVQKLDTQEQLKEALSRMRVPFLMQEYCSQPLETGIFYYRYPGEKRGHIPSVTLKEFLAVVGDGVHTLEELLLSNPRALLQKERLRAQLGAVFSEVIPNGKRIELEPVGNHNRGTRFIDGTHLVDDTLLDVFDALSRQMEGFYFGRFDIRAESWEALKMEGKYMILEVNGVGGEPTHIYDPANSLLKAWQSLCASWRIAAKIAEINFKRGISKPSTARARQLWKSYQGYKTKLHAREAI